MLKDRRGPTHPPRPGRPVARLTHPLLLLLPLILIITSACVHPETPAQPQPASQSPQGLPLVSSSRQTLTQDQADRQIAEYVTLTLAVTVVTETAVDSPGRFHQALTWNPDTSCVVQLRQDASPPAQPVQPQAQPEQDQAQAQPEQDQAQDQQTHMDAARSCLQSQLDRQDPNLWPSMDESARRAQARASLEQAWDTIDPSLLLSAKLASQRRLQAGPHNNDQLAALAAQYAHCNQAARYAPPLASAPTSAAAADIWLQAAGDANDCYRQTILRTHRPSANGTGHPHPPEKMQPQPTR